MVFCVEYNKIDTKFFTGCTFQQTNPLVQISLPRDLSVIQKLELRHIAFGCICGCKGDIICEIPITLEICIQVDPVSLLLGLPGKNVTLNDKIRLCSTFTWCYGLVQKSLLFKAGKGYYQRCKVTQCKYFVTCVEILDIFTTWVIIFPLIFSCTSTLSHTLFKKVESHYSNFIPAFHCSKK